MKLPPKSKSFKIKTIKDVKNVGLYLFVTIGLILIPETILATSFNIDAAGRAMFNPIVSFIDAWYGTGIFASGVGGAIVASGDLRTRALGFGMGSVIAGLTLLGVKAGFDVKTVMINHCFA